ncbi:hypothetical protein B0T20DRAFT_250755 [Sordaria brevicollis]|uniref:Uncharacterized protein n=1 Tax=Sordaria brevicollis TaxID=83679 RepID=A0AAE0PC36_SORBR|nr:hypothetical protein B0T20DRAFT_250755 [Sordaria brevicollis]
MPEWAQPQVGLCFNPWNSTRSTVRSQYRRDTQFESRWPGRRRQLFPSSLSTPSQNTTPPPQFSDSNFLVRECPSWPLGLFGSFAVRRSFESCIRSLLKLCRAWDYCGFRVFVPTFSDTQSVLVSELNPKYTPGFTHPKLCALRAVKSTLSPSTSASSWCLLSGFCGAAEKLRPLGSWYFYWMARADWQR